MRTPEQKSLRRRALLTRVGSAGLGLTGLALTGTVASQGSETGGSIHWRYPTGGPVASSPTVVDGTVYVGSQDGSLVAVRASDSTESWSVDVGTPVGSSPNVVAGTVYVGGGDRGVLAVDAATGSVEWSFGAVETVRASPTVVGGVVYAGDAGGTLYAVDADTGTERWHYDPDGRGDATAPTVVDGTVYYGTQTGEVHAVDASAGTNRWTASVFGAASPPSVAGGRVFVGSANPTNVSAFHWKTGATLWQFGLEGMSQVIGIPTAVRDTVYAASGNRRCYALAVDTGEIDWTYRAGGSIVSSPTVATDRVFVGSSANSDGASLHAVEASSGDVVWTASLGEQVLSSPTVVDGTLYVGSTDGHLYAVDAGGDGSSEDSRVALATLGHHDGWTGEPVTADRFRGTPEAPASPAGTPSTDTANTPTSGKSAGSADGATEGATGPGPGLVGSAGAMVGTGYLAARWNGSDDES